MKNSRLPMLMLIVYLIMTLMNHGFGYSYAESPIRLPILMYHSILPDSEGLYTVDVETFRSDMEYLRREGYETVSCRDLVSYKEGGSLPSKPILITFDDGYVNNLTYAVPILKEYGYRATFNVVGEYTTGEVPRGDYATMNIALLRQLMESGVAEIGNHSYAMHAFTPRYGTDPLDGETSAEHREVILEDIQRMQDYLSRELGVTPVVYAAPFGTFSRELISALEEVGVPVNLSCSEGINELRRATKLNYLKRILRDPSLDSETFFRKNRI